MQGKRHRRGGEEVKILNAPSITTGQILDSLLAIPAFLPLTFCTGYLAAWFTDLHGFRQRTLIDRIFWSVPLSVATSTIASFLIAKFISLTAVVVFFLASAVLSLAVLGTEWFQLRRSGREWRIGFQPLGGMALILAVIWIAIAVLSQIDFEAHQRLFFSLTFYDHGARISWIESILRTGVPPNNPYYFFQHTAAMRNYYFWYVLCAAVSKVSHLPVRAVLISSCVWAGFALATLTGLFLKYFIEAGARLRRQFLISISLLLVSGLDICVYFCRLIFLHIPPGAARVWAAGQINGWYMSLLFVPHHVASMVCCMLAFLLAWMPRRNDEDKRIVSVAVMSAALASAFGLSVYVTFAFFLLMLIWGLWQVTIARVFRPTLMLASAGLGATVLLIPFLLELTHSSSGMQRSAAFGFAVRETILPEGLLASSLFQHLATIHPSAARNLANLLLLAPGIAVELGFFLIVYLVYLLPSWRGNTPLTRAQRSLMVITTAAVLLTSLVRSWVLSYNDFGIRGGLLLQFPLLLLASELLLGWRLESRESRTSSQRRSARYAPLWVRSGATLSIFLGALTTVYIAFMLRFLVPIAEMHITRVYDPNSRMLSHKAFISLKGYAQLDASVPHDSIVQFNPSDPIVVWTNTDLANINHQVAIAGDQLWCGAELGGDPSGCPAMAAAIDALFTGASAVQARTTCRNLGIDYLVATVYDPAWKDPQGWVWILSPVVSDEEFRALDCRR
jgi:hypothetical protein